MRANGRSPPSLPTSWIVTTALRRAGPEPEVGCGLHLHLDGGRLALRGCGDRPVSRRVVGWSMKAEMTSQLGHGCADDGALAARPAQGAASPLRSRIAIHERPVPAPHDRAGRHLFDEPIRQLLGQCGDGELLLLAEDGAKARKTYRTRDEARADVFDYVERFYNAKRRHSTLGYLSPLAFEEQAALA